MKKTSIHRFAFSIVLAAATTGCVADLQRESQPEELEQVDITRQAAASCYQSSCNGQDPAEMNCDDPERTETKSWKYIYDDTTGDILGKIEMRYSAECDAQWARVDSDTDTNYVSKVALRSLDDRTTYSFKPHVANREYYWTTMQHSPSTQLRAHGAIECDAEACDNLGYNWVDW